MEQSIDESCLNEAQEFLEGLKKTPPALPYEPTLIPMLFAATQGSSKASMDDIAKLIEKSPKLASKVLAVANSPLYAPPLPVSSLSRAISILGFNEVRTLFVTIGAVSSMEKANLPFQFDGYKLWQHQVETAFIAKALSTALLEHKVTPEPSALLPDEAYVSGLLHDIGKIFLASRKPQLWSALTKVAERSGASLAEKEREYWGIDHGVIGSIVLRAWGLPEVLIETIADHHKVAPENNPQKASSLLTAANILAHSPPSLGVAELDEKVYAFLPPIKSKGLLRRFILDACASGRAEAMLQSIL